MAVQKSKKQTLERATAQSTELAAEIRRYIQLCQWARECLENSFKKGLGYKKESLEKDDVLALRDVGISLERAVSCQIKYDKHIENRADDLTPEQEEDAFVEWILAKPKDDCRRILKKCVSRYNKMVGIESIPKPETLEHRDEVAENGVEYVRSETY